MSYLLAAILIPTVNGFLVSAWFLKNDPQSSVMERVVLGFGLGLGFLTFEIFILGALEVSFSVRIISLIQAVFFCSLILNYRFVGGLNRAFLFGSRSASGVGSFFVNPFKGGFSLKSLAVVIMLLWIGLKALFVLDECLARPIYSIDAWGHWASGAKFFFYERGFLLDPSKWNYFGRGYRVELSYPLHLSLIELWAALWLGHFHEAYVKIWSALYFLALVIFFFTAAAREVGRFRSLIWVFFLVSAPLMVYHGIEGLSDLPLAFYTFTGVVFFWRYMKSRDMRLLALSGLLIGMAICTKYEALFFFAALLLALSVSMIVKREKVLVSVAAFLLPVLIIAGPWLFFKKISNLSTTHGVAESRIASFVKKKDVTKEQESIGNGGVTREQGTLKRPAAAQRVAQPVIHWEIFDDIFIMLFTSANYNLIFSFWLLLSLLCYKKIWRTDLKYLYLVQITVFFLFILLYLVVAPEVVTEGFAIYRNVLSYLPLLYFCSALLLKEESEP
jgi:4-amino-4-deoxy-L-arabinose transferase-like glycosyltransferase